MGHWQGEIWNRRKSGEIYPQLLSISSVLDGDGDVIRYIGLFSDISNSEITGPFSVSTSSAFISA